MGSAMNVQRASQATAEDFRNIPTSILSDNLERLRGTSGLRPFHTGQRMVGRALTVKTREGDNLAIHQALAGAEANTVIVVDGGGSVSRALVGAIMKEIAESRGVRGFVIDGAIRDADSFRADTFPCFARGVTHRGPYKDGPGHINIAVSIDGNVVQPGDFVVGDEDGIVFFSPSEATELLAKAAHQIAAEGAIIERIRAGHYENEYARPGK